MALTSLHYLYMIMVVIILVIMLMKKEIVIPCIIGIYAMGFLYSGSAVLPFNQYLTQLFIQAMNFGVL